MALSFKSVIYESKKGQLGQVSIGDIAKAISGELGPGVAVNTSKAKAALKKAVDARKKGKFLDAVVKVGLVGKDLTLGILSKKDEAKAVLIKDYEKVKAASQKGPRVVSGQKGDATVDSSVDKYSKAKGGSVEEGDLKKKGDRSPIVIIAHGGSAESQGKVYAKKFASKSPDELVRFLIKDKKLPKSYAGTLYLDGCFTAAGKTDENYARKVYKKLVAKGYKYMQVKGNLGRAAVMSDGGMAVLDAQEQKRLQEKVKKDYQAASARLEQSNSRQKELKKVWDNIWAKKYQQSGDADAFFADDRIKLLQPEIQKLKQDVDSHTATLKQLEKDYADITKSMKYRVVDLVGTFGPEKLRKHRSYRRLLG